MAMGFFKPGLTYGLVYLQPHLANATLCITTNRNRQSQLSMRTTTPFISNTSNPYKGMHIEHAANKQTTNSTQAKKNPRQMKFNNSYIAYNTNESIAVVMLVDLLLFVGKRLLVFVVDESSVSQHDPRLLRDSR